MRRSAAALVATVALTLLTGLAIVLVVAAGPAWAHDELLHTNPADGSTVAAPPAQVVLTFAEPALDLGTVVAVTGPSGPVSSGKPVLSGVTLTQTLLPDLPAGAYTVAWRVTSDDGHPVDGKFTFTATAGATPSPSQAQSVAPLPTGATSATPVATTERDRLSYWVIGGVVLLGLVLTGVTLLLRRQDLRDKTPGRDDGRGDG